MTGTRKRNVYRLKRLAARRAQREGIGAKSAKTGQKPEPEGSGLSQDELVMRIILRTLQSALEI